MILASRSVTYPFGRKRVLVFDGAWAMMKKDATAGQNRGWKPLAPGLTPDQQSRETFDRNIHLHPAYPSTPLICSRPAPRNDVTMFVNGLMV